MPHAKPFIVAVLAAALCACQPLPTRPSTTSAAPSSSPAWRGVAVLADPALAPRTGTLEVVLVALGNDDAKPLAHAEFAVKPSARIDFALPADDADDATPAQVGWRVWLRDASGHLRYASDRVVAANRDALATVPLSRIAPR